MAVQYSCKSADLSVRLVAWINFALSLQIVLQRTGLNASMQKQFQISSCNTNNLLAGN